MDLQAPVPTDSFDGNDGVLGVWLERGWDEPVDGAPNGTIGSTLVATYRLEAGASTVSALSGARPQRGVAEEDWIQVQNGGSLTVDGDRLRLDIGPPRGQGETDVPEAFGWTIGVFFQTAEQSADRYDWSSESWCPTSALEDPDGWSQFPGDAAAVRSAKESFERLPGRQPSTTETTSGQQAGAATASTTTVTPSSIDPPDRLDEAQTAQRFIDAWNGGDVEMAWTVADDEVVKYTFSEPSNRDATLLRCRNWNDIPEGEYQGFGTAVCDGRYTAQWMIENESLRQNGGTLEIYVDGGASGGYRVSGVGFNGNPPAWSAAE